jgi:hypothetical protein
VRLARTRQSGKGGTRLGFFKLGESEGWWLPCLVSLDLYPTNTSVQNHWLRNVLPGYLYIAVRVWYLCVAQAFTFLDSVEIREDYPKEI